MIFSVPTFAKTYIVEIADFSCKYCLEAEHYTPKLKFLTEKNNDEFIFAPVVLNEGSTAEELFYYALRGDSRLEEFARKAMFKLKQEQRLKMSNVGDVHDWVNIYFSKDDELLSKIDEKVSEASINFHHVKSYIKAFHLVEKNNIISTPTFLIIDEEASVTVVSKPENLQIPDYIEHVVDMYKRISKNED